MPRQGRLHIPGAVYHVMGRGLERRNIFKTSEDKETFLLRFVEGLQRTNTECMAWCIMTNHYHFLLRVAETPLSKLMQPLLGGYASAYNRRRKRVGYVFQNRFKSILCDADSYFLELLRYIHLNPVKARIVSSIDKLAFYPWTGHACVMGNQLHEWQNIEAVLERFPGNKRNCLQRYRQFIIEGLDDVTTNKLNGGGLIRSHGGWENIQSMRAEHETRIGDERILGDSAFVKSALEHDDLNLAHRAALRIAGWDIETVIQHICSTLQVEAKCLLSKGRNNELSYARSLICYFLNKELGISGSRVAMRLNISQAAVSQSVRRGEKLKISLNIDLQS